MVTGFCGLEATPVSNYAHTLALISERTQLQNEDEGEAK